MKRIHSLILVIFVASVSFNVYSQENSIEAVTRKLVETGEFNDKEFIDITKDMHPGERESRDAYNALLMAYIGGYLRFGASRLPELESLLTEYFSTKQWRNILIQTAQDGIFNDFLSERLATIEDLAAASQSEDEKEYYRFALHTYRAFQVYHSMNLEEKEDEQVWASMYDELRSAGEIYPLQDMMDLYLDACNALQKNREYFEIKAHHYYTREDPNLFAYLYLFYRHMLIKGEKKGFGIEMTDIRAKVKKEVMDYLPEFPFKKITPYEYISGMDETEVVDPADPTSVIYGKKLLLVFFNTDCHFCGKELQLLSNLYRRIQRGGGEIIGINTMYTHSGQVFDEVASFRKEHKIRFPTYMDIKGNLSVMEYRIPSVPFLVLVNGDGTIHKAIKFQYDGHLQMKLSWFLNDFLDINL